MDGYICLYRKMLSWEWMQEPYTAHLFTCLLLMANQDEGWEYMGIKLHAGQLITSLDKLGERTGLTKKLVRTRLERLQRSGELEVQSYKMGTLITIKNYSCYQYQQNSEGTQMGTSLGTHLGTHKKAVKASQTKEIKGTAAKLGTPLGTQMGTPLGTHAENAKNMGTPLGTTLGTPQSSVKSTNTDGCEEQQQKVGTQMGTEMGTIQYNITNNILSEKKNKKESTEPVEAVLSTSELEQMFETFRKAYHGTKRGFKVEFENFKKKHQQDWKEIVPLLMPALERMEESRKEAAAKGMFVPQYAMLQTWLNQSRWTMEYETINTQSNGTTEITAGAGADVQPVPNYEEEF